MMFYVVYVLTFLVVTFATDEGFFQSARSGDVNLVSQYIANGVFVNARDSKGNSAIIIAAGRGHVNILAILLENGASIEDFTYSGLFEGKTVLCWAASQGRTQAVAFLLQAGANPNKLPDRGVFEGKTALMWASSQGRVNVIRTLLSVGVDINFSSQIGNFKVIA